MRPSACAGTWYPGNAADLTAIVDRLLRQTPCAPLSGELVALLVPHAGYDYSGPTAAAAFCQLEGQRYRRIVVVGPSHRVAGSPVLLPAEAAYATPLGEVPLDVRGLRALHDALPGQVRVVAGDREHAIEMQLPLLQRLLPQFELLPVMVTSGDASTAAALGAALSDLLRATAGPSLLVASSDLSHYHDEREARRLDQVFLARLAALDVPGFLAATALGQAEACGAGAVATVMAAATRLGANRVTTLGYATSGDVTGPPQAGWGVVGYAAAAITRVAAPAN